MKKIIESKKILICVIATLIIIGLIVGGIFLFSKNNDKKTQNNETTNNYVAYIKINPLIKIEYSQTCKNENCNDPIVTNYELVNDDAKDIYKDIDLIGTNNNLYDVITLISKIAEENNIEFENVEIYSNWDNLNNYIDNSNKDNYKWSYIVNIRDKENLEDISSSLEGNKILYNIVFETDGGTEINTQTVEKGKLAIEPTTPTKEGYKFIEWQLDGKKFDFSTKIKNNITLIAKWNKKETNKNETAKPTETATNNDTNKKEEIKDYNLVTVAERIEMKNISSSCTAVFEDKNKQIIINVSGNKSKIEKYSIIELSKYNLTANLSSLQEGTHSVKIEIAPNHNEFKYVVSPTTITVKVSCSDKPGVINLNDNVMYMYGGSTWKCDNCIPNSIIQKVRTSKGICDKGSDSNKISFRSLSIPEGKYSNPTYWSANSDLEMEIYNSGAEMQGGEGDGPFLLTEQVCNEYHLSCDRW